MNALGMIEMNSIAIGIEAGDIMVKAADVELVSAQAACPGKYIVLVQGDVAAVKSSVEVIGENYESALINKMVIPNIHEDVFSAIACATKVNQKNAVGIIETFSLVTCILAADTAVKAADVNLIEIRLGRGLGGKSFVLMTGDVSAIRFGIEAAKDAHMSEGLIINTSIIPSMHPDMLGMLV